MARRDGEDVNRPPVSEIGRQQCYEAAQILLRARRGRYQIDDLPERCRPLTLADGYAIQHELQRLLGNEGDGWLLGLTNPSMQRLFGATGPYFARLLVGGHTESPATVRAADFCTLGIECEVTFTMRSSLPPCSGERRPSEVADAVACAHPSVEIVNAHYVDWLRMPLPSIVADNGVDGLLVVGAGLADWAQLDMASMGVHLIVDGLEVANGNAGLIMGCPLRALTWLANELNRKGQQLREGELVNTGTCVELYFARAGQRLLADFEGLGQVSIGIE